MNKMVLTDKIFIDPQSIFDKSTVGCNRNVIIMAKTIAKDLQVARDEGGSLYYYSGGVYRPHGELAVAEMYRRNLMMRDFETDWSSRFRNEVVACMLDDSPLVLHAPDLERINLLNGLFDWREGGGLQPHDSEYRTTVQIPIHYDPVATCPQWDKFLYEIFPEGVDLLQQVIALCMIPLMDLQKCIVLVGEGSNGKSAFLNGLKAAVGKNNTCAVSLHKLASNNERFNTAGLIGKLVNIFGDLSPKAIEDTANFKALTGEDSITVELKGKQPFDYTSFCRLIFSCNKLVKSEDDLTLGYMRRFIHIPFMKKFQVNPKIGLELKDSLSSPTELSGLFNKLIPWFSRFVEEGFYISDEVASMIDNYTPMPDTTRSWLLENVIADPNGFIPSSMFYNYYTSNCMAVEAFTRSKLITYMKNTFPGVKCNWPKHVWQGFNPIKCYIGVRLKDSDVASGLLASAARTKHQPDTEDVVYQ